jgi:hypothetical protein
MAFGRSIVIAKLVLLLSTSFWVASAQDQKQEARAFAESVLKMKDAKQYRDMYRDKFHASMRQQMSEEQWLAAAESVDRQAGALKSRTLESSDQSLGVFKFRYNAVYENGKAFDEIYVAKEGSAFKVIGLWVKPNI